MKIKNPVICKNAHCRIIAFWVLGIAGLWTASVFKDDESQPLGVIVAQVLQEEQELYFDDRIPVFINVETKKEEKAPAKPAVAAKKVSKTVNINTAGMDDLVLLPGIGQAIGQKIIDYRRQNGNFMTVEDLKKVSGIGEKKFEALKDYIKI